MTVSSLVFSFVSCSLFSFCCFHFVSFAAARESCTAFGWFDAFHTPSRSKWAWRCVLRALCYGGLVFVSLRSLQLVFSSGSRMTAVLCSVQSLFFSFLSSWINTRRVFFSLRILLRVRQLQQNTNQKCVIFGVRGQFYYFSDRFFLMCWWFYCFFFRLFTQEHVLIFFRWLNFRYRQ